MYKIRLLSLISILVLLLNACKENDSINLIGSGTEFVLTFKTTGAQENITIPINPLFTYDYNIDWGDGTIESNQIADATHTYTTAGTYQVLISGTFPAISFGFSARKLQSIDQWGSIEWQTMKGAFVGCENMIFTALDTPNLSDVTDMSNMFRGAINFNQDISNWDVSNVTNMSWMFSSANAFNQNIDNWDVSNVTNMSGMFSGTATFNQNIGNWDVSNVTNMSGMFQNASTFNQNIDNWDVSNVTNMSGMFSGTATFNQNIGNWDVSNVTNMLNMFSGAATFNQDIGAWDVSSATVMTQMFYKASAFNQDIGAWDVSGANSLFGMFWDASNFNQNISNWDVSGVNVCNFFSLNSALETNNKPNFMFCSE